ncbi:MAG: hypothetical protein HXY35_06855 [Chloroflexi bacterium]|nr:hypothetical protein [Chloroflexota bacterium]
MNSFFQKLIQKPILLLLAVNILGALFLFRNYGLSWDEPYFYQYADALGYAYSPHEWFSGHFDLENSFGPSGTDHKTRGPAYLLLARGPVHLLEKSGLDEASAWHLVNFLFFQLGVYFLYRILTRWVKPSAAFAASVLFAWQPLLWGHAFINPKDPSFLTFFLGSICLGFEMIDRWADKTINARQKLISAVPPAILLGIAASIRILGPLAGLVVGVYAVYRFGKQFKKILPPFALYGVIATLVMFAAWPYLWQSPVSNFIEVLRFMSDNPTELPVLFGGEVYPAGGLPRSYLPFMLFATLTEPVWLLFGAGLALGYLKLQRQKNAIGIVSLSLVLFWFILPVAYVILRKPSMYDGLRHFMFIIPPIFIATGFVFEFLFAKFSSIWLRAGIVAILLLPGLIGIAYLHPYEYAYYNSLVGGTGKVFREYETEYWLTCYKEAVGKINQEYTELLNLYVNREAYIAAYYANDNINALELKGALKDVRTGDFILVNSRTNEDRKIFKDAPEIIRVTRGNATFCVIKQIP